jgi:hypothetical protein
MAKIEQRGTIECECVIRLSEEEMRFLDGMTGYGWKGFIETFHKHMGTSYTRDHLKGGEEFFTSIRACILPILRRTDDARAVFVGEKEARKPNRDADAPVPSDQRGTE